MATLYSTGFVNGLWDSSKATTILLNGVIGVYSGTAPANADQPLGSVTLLGWITNNGGTFTAGSVTNGLQWERTTNRKLTKLTGQNWVFTPIATGQMSFWRYQGNAADNGLYSETLVRIQGNIGTFQAELEVASLTATVGVTQPVSKAEIEWPLITS